MLYTDLLVDFFSDITEFSEPCPVTCLLPWIRFELW